MLTLVDIESQGIRGVAAWAHDNGGADTTALGEAERASIADVVDDVMKSHQQEIADTIHNTRC